MEDENEYLGEDLAASLPKIYPIPLCTLQQNDDCVFSVF